jgi:hypothetical protein
MSGVLIISGMNYNIAFRYLDARRLGAVKSQVNINNNSTIVAVTREGEKSMNVGFVFSSSYEPNIGVIRIEGDLSVEDTPDTIEKSLKEWERSERAKLPKEVAEGIHNAILSNCMVEASILARDIKLPLPMPMPQVALNAKDSTDTSYIR